MKSNIREWNIVEYLNSEEAITAYLNAAREERDSALFQAALEDIAKVHGMSEVIREANTDSISL